MRRYGEEIEADLDRYYNGMDLLDFYRGRLSARTVWVRVRMLPPDSATVSAAKAAEPSEPTRRDQQAKPAALAPVRCLSDIPVAGSLREVGKFLNASNDEFSQMAG